MTDEGWGELIIEVRDRRLRALEQQKVIRTQAAQIKALEAQVRARGTVIRRLGILAFAPDASLAAIREEISVWRSERKKGIVES